MASTSPSNPSNLPNPPSPYNIRPARFPDDLAGVLALYDESTRFHAESWPENFEPASVSASPPEPGRGELTDELQRGYADPSNAMFVAELAGALIGLVSGGVAEPPAYGMERSTRTALRARCTTGGGSAPPT